MYSTVLAQGEKSRWKPGWIMNVEAMQAVLWLMGPGNINTGFTARDCSQELRLSFKCLLPLICLINNTTLTVKIQRVRHQTEQDLLPIVITFWHRNIVTVKTKWCCLFFKLIVLNFQKLFLGIPFMYRYFKRWQYFLNSFAHKGKNLAKQHYVIPHVKEA